VATVKKHMISERFADSKVDETSQIRQWHELIQDLLQLEPSNRSTCKQISDKLSAPALPPCSGKNTGTESSSKCAPKDKKNTSPNPMSQASRGPVSPPEVKGPKGGTEDNSSSLSPAMHVLPSRSTSPENLVRPPSSSASPENSVVSPRSKVLSPRSRSTSTSPVRFAQRVTGLISRLGNNAQNRTSPLAKDLNTKPSTDCDSGLLARTSSPARKLRSAVAGQRLSRREPRSGHLTSSSDLLSDDQETPPPDSVSHASGSSLTRTSTWMKPGRSPWQQQDPDCIHLSAQHPNPQVWRWRAWIARYLPPDTPIGPRNLSLLQFWNDLVDSRSGG